MRKETVIPRRSQPSRGSSASRKDVQLTLGPDRATRSSTRRIIANGDRFIRPACGSSLQPAEADLVCSALRSGEKRRERLIDLIISRDANVSKRRRKSHDATELEERPVANEVLFAALHDNVTFDVDVAAEGPRSHDRKNSRNCKSNADLAYWSIAELEAEAGISRSSDYLYSRVRVLASHQDGRERKRFESPLFLERWSQTAVGIHPSKAAAKQLAAKATFVPRPSRPWKSCHVYYFDQLYSSNIVSWNENGTLAFGHGRAVCFSFPQKNVIGRAFYVTGEDDEVASLCWLDGEIIAVGTKKGCLEFWDGFTCTLLGQRFTRIFSGRPVISISCNQNRTFVTAGSAGGAVVNVSILDSDLSRWRGHSSAVLKMKWNKEGSRLVSASADGTVCLHDASMWKRGCRPNTFEPVAVLSGHTERVGDVDWHPRKKDLLVTCSDDHTVKFWDTERVRLLDSFDTGSVVTSVLWSEHQDELLTSHGAGTSDQYILWSYPLMEQLQTFRCNSRTPVMMERVFGGKGMVAVCCNGEEEEYASLVFWESFGPRPTGKEKSKGSSKLAICTDLKLPGTFTVR